MSIWSFATGTIDTSKAHHVSVKKLTNDIFDGDDHSLSLIEKDVFIPNKSLYHMELRFCNDGESAIKQFNQFTAALKAAKISYDLELTTRHIS